MKITLKEMTFIAMLIALMAIMAQIAVPLPFTPVPITLQTAGLILGLLVGGKRAALLAVGIYLLLGLAGAPVFHMGKAGPGILFGPTGGFLMGFLPALFLAATAWEHSPQKGLKAAYLSAVLLIAVVLLCGILWFMFISGSSFLTAFTLTCLPFIPGDAAKILIFTPLSLAIARRLPEMKR